MSREPRHRNSGLPLVFAIVLGVVLLLFGALLALTGDGGVLAFDYGGF